MPHNPPLAPLSGLPCQPPPQHSHLHSGLPPPQKCCLISTRTKPSPPTSQLRALSCAKPSQTHLPRPQHLALTLSPAPLHLSSLPDLCLHACHLPSMIKLERMSEKYKSKWCIDHTLCQGASLTSFLPAPMPTSSPVHHTPEEGHLVPFQALPPPVPSQLVESSRVVPSPAPARGKVTSPCHLRLSPVAFDQRQKIEKLKLKMKTDGEVL